MSNSAITFNTAGLASTTSPGLVGTGAQTFAGKKTLDGGALIKGDTSGVAIATGYVGEKLYAENNTLLNLGTPGSNAYVSVTNTFVDITAGTWLLTFCVSVQTALTGTGEAHNKARIQNTTDNIMILETAGGYASVVSGTSTPPALWTPHAGSQLVTVSATKRMQVQIAWHSNSGPPTISGIYSRGDRAAASITAIRFA